MCLIHIFCLFDLFVFTKAISYDSPYIVYWYSVYKIHCCWGEQAVHQRRIFIFSFGVVDKYLGGAAACFGRAAVATPGKAKENV